MKASIESIQHRFTQEFACLGVKILFVQHTHHFLEIGIRVFSISDIPNQVIIEDGVLKAGRVFGDILSFTSMFASEVHFDEPCIPEKLQHKAQSIHARRIREGHVDEQQSLLDKLDIQAFGQMAMQYHQKDIERHYKR